MNNTVKDLTRAIERVDRNASADPADIPPGEELSFSDMLTSVARGIGYQFDRAGISPRRVPDTAIVAILAAHGMSYHGIEQWAGDIADRVRADYSHGRMSSQSLETVAQESRDIATARDGAE